MAINNLKKALGFGKRDEKVGPTPEEQRALETKAARGKIPLSVKRRKIKEGKVVLEVKDLETSNDKGATALNKVSFSIRGGEILGFAGVMSCGHNDLANVIVGLKKATGGSVHILGRDLTNSQPKKIVDQGVAHLPEDRTSFGVIMNLSIRENLILGAQSDPRFKKRWLLNNPEIDRHAEKLIKEYDIKPPNKDAQVRTLTGDNIVRVLLARELSREPKLIVANQPTKGLDLVATRYVQDRLMEQRNKGVAILLVSEDLNEIMSLSDRIAVMHQGRIVDSMPASKAKIGEIGLMMAGVRAPVRKRS